MAVTSAWPNKDIKVLRKKLLKKRRNLKLEKQFK